METASSIRFSAAARLVAAEARDAGLVVPGFRSPPRITGADRTVRRRPDGGAIVAVRVRGRPFAAVANDLVEGVVAVNGLAGDEADRCRRRLWRVLEREGARAA